MPDAREFYARNPHLRDGFADDFLLDEPREQMLAESAARVLALLAGVGIAHVRKALPGVMRELTK